MSNENDDMLTVSFGEGVVTRCNYAPQSNGDGKQDIFKTGFFPSILPITLENITKKKCPHHVQVEKQWSPKWDDYVHCHKYNYSITINTDPKAKWYKDITNQDRMDDHLIIQQIRDKEQEKLKKVISQALADKVIKNITIVYENGENNKRHYHMLVLTSRKTQFKLMIEKEFEMSMEPHGTGWMKRDPINLIRPKKMRKCVDCRSALEKAQEVLDAIDYIIYTYYQKENIGENLLLNIIRKI